MWIFYMLLSDYLLPCFILSKAKATLSMPDITK